MREGDQPEMTGAVSETFSVCDKNTFKRCSYVSMAFLCSFISQRRDAFCQYNVLFLGSNVTAAYNTKTIHIQNLILSNKYSIHTRPDLYLGTGLQFVGSVGLLPVWLPSPTGLHPYV